MKFARPSVRAVSAAVALAAAAHFAPSALAGPVGPGQTINLGGAAPFVASGELVASQTFTKTVTLRAMGGINGEPVGFVIDGGLGDISVGLTVDNRVYREADGGALTFVYTLMADLADASDERSDLTVGGFAGFSTDANVGPTHGAMEVSRSADGATVLNSLTNAGLGDLPLTFAVRTDATSYNAGGTLGFSFGEEYLVRPLVPEFPDRPDLDDRLGSGSGNADFAGLYQPAAAAPPAVVPLPSAAWGGGLTLSGMGLVALRRRRAGAARA